MRNIGEAFTFPFKDPDWLSKFLIGGIFVLLSFILIGIPVLFGYCIELQQRVRRNEERPLPEWTEPGVKFITGFKFLVTVFIYYVPIIIVVIPMFIIFALAAIQGSSIATLFGSALFATIIVMIIVPYALFITILTPIISVKYGERERIADGLQIRKVLQIFKHHWQDAVVATLITIGIEALSSIGIIFFLIGILFTSFYASLVRFHLYGQIAQQVYPQTTITPHPSL